MTDREALDDVTRRHLLARVARAQRDERLPSLSVAVSDDDRTLWSAGRGRVHGQRPSSDVQYRIGSITKTFTAVLVLQLRDEGLLHLSDPIDRWLPSAAALAGRSVCELLSHTGGVRAETSPPWWERTPGRTWDELLGDLDADGVPAGTRGGHHYSNLGYAALGRLVAQVRGAAWADVLRERLLLPLGLRRTTVAPAPPFADGFAVHPWSDTLIAEPAHDTGAMGPAGQLWSTADDLAAWGRFLLGDTGGVLAPATLAEMAQARVPTGRAAGESYGLGLQVTTSAHQILVGHAGSMPGYLAHVQVEREQGLVGVALANSTAGLNGTLLADLLTTVASRHPRVVDDWAPCDDGMDDLPPILGVWYWGPRPYAVACCEEPGVLALTAIGAPGRDTRLDLTGPPWMCHGGYFDGEPVAVRCRDDGTVSHLELASFVFTREPYAPVDVIPGGAVTHG